LDGMACVTDDEKSRLPRLKCIYCLGMYLDLSEHQECPSRTHNQLKKIHTYAPTNLVDFGHITPWTRNRRSKSLLTWHGKHQVGATTLAKSYVRSKHRVCATLAARTRNSGHIKFLLEGPALDTKPLSFSESNYVIPQIQGMRPSPQSLE
jgi:hypothetical protein